MQNIIDQANVGVNPYAHYLDKDDLMKSSVEMFKDELGQNFADSNDGDAQDVINPQPGLITAHAATALPVQGHAWRAALAW